MAWRGHMRHHPQHPHPRSACPFPPVEPHPLSLLSSAQYWAGLGLGTLTTQLLVGQVQELKEGPESSRRHTAGSGEGSRCSLNMSQLACLPPVPCPAPITRPKVKQVTHTLASRCFQMLGRAGPGQLGIRMVSTRLPPCVQREGSRL